MISNGYKLTKYSLILLVTAVILHHTMLMVSNNYLELMWKLGRKITSEDILAYTKKANEAEIKQLLNNLLSNTVNNHDILMVFISSASRDKSGNCEMRIVYNIAGDRRFPDEIRRAALVPMCVATNQVSRKMLQQIASDATDPISNSAQKYLDKYYAKPTESGVKSPENDAGK